ncbi:MAG: LD-carboxypeptidase [Chlorobi bacterium]|nr:LD-carboxypeptidase [Chlorobiota bacterium]
MEDEAIRPAPLREGSKILFVAPAGRFTDREALNRMVHWVESRGWKAEVHPGVFHSFGSLAGTPEERAAAMQDAFERTDIAAIWAVRGGYGSIHLLDRLDFSPLRNYPKWLIGFSDITAFHLYLHRYGLQSLHAFMPVQWKEDIPPEVLEITERLLRHEAVPVKVPRDAVNVREQPVKGILIGGNAAVLASCLSACTLSFKDRILFLEDTDEHLYALDRIFHTIFRSPAVRGVRALILGHFTGIRQDDPPFPWSVKQMITRLAEPLEIPVFFGFPAGHEPENYPMIFGSRYRIDLTETHWTLQPDSQNPLA